MNAERVEQIRCGLEAFLKAAVAVDFRQAAVTRMEIAGYRLWVGGGYFDPRMVLLWDVKGNEIRNPYPIDGHSPNEFSPDHAARMVADALCSPLTSVGVAAPEPPKKYLLTHQTRITGAAGTKHTLQGTMDGQSWETVQEWFEANPAPPPAVTDGQGRFVNPPPPPDYSGLFVPPGDSETLRDQASDSRAKENASFGK